MVTGKELCEGIDNEGNEYIEVEEKLSGTWRWGNIYETIYKRESDGTYWMMEYRTANENGIEWDSVSVSQVEPIQETITITKWKTIK